MSKVLQDYFPRSISQYVPNMEFSADVVGDQHLVSLGAPAALDADGIWDGVTIGTSAATHTSSDYKSTFDGSSTSLTTTAGMIDASYGRCLRCTGNASTDQVVTVIGRDYLGQGMRENFTLSGTSVIYGEKAFKFVDSTSVAAGTGGTTLDVGWDDRLGLPYCAQGIIRLWQDDAIIPINEVTIPVIAVDGVSADTVFAPAQNDGFVIGMTTAVAIATQSGDTILTVEIGGVAVAGLSVTVAASSGIGTLDADNSITNDHGTTSDVAANTLIEVVSDGGTATTGTIDCYVGYQEGMLFTAGDRTATQTATTNDTRGTIQPYTACDGSVTYEVCYLVNTADLHGIEQFNG